MVNFNLTLGFWRECWP